MMWVTMGKWDSLVIVRLPFLALIALQKIMDCPCRTVIHIRSDFTYLGLCLFGTAVGRLRYCPKPILQ